LALTALIPFAAPVFPSQDGPVHLYYADVLRGILTHSAPYAQYFELKSWLTPYALEYYSLMALETVFPLEVSEKLLLCGYILLFGLGFRYLVESVAERGSPWILAGIPFSMHMLVYMGFLNYSFAVALLLILCGLWIRYSGHLTKGRVALLLAGLVLTLLTHPIPVAVFLLFIGLYAAIDLVQDAAAGQWRWKACLRARRRPLVLMAAMATVAILWVALFVDRSQRTPEEPNYASVLGWLRVVVTELVLAPVAPFTSLSYRAGPVLLLGAAGLTFFMGFWKDGRRHRTAAIALAAAGAICFLLYGIVPPRVNGSYYFPERFPILGVLFVLAGAAALGAPRRWSVATGSLAACVAVGVVALQWSHVRELSAQLAPAFTVPPVAAGSLGVIVGPPKSLPDGLAFNPYMWAGAHFFRRSSAILLNAPWMDQPLIMLRPAHPDRWSYLDPDYASQALIGGRRGGTPVPNPDIVVEDGAPDAEIDGLLNRMGWRDSGGNSFLRIFRRQ
jgi:hypothetical protein